MADKTQHKIGRNRPPRVQITYDVEIGDAMQVKELPFIVGVLADLSGDSEAKKLKERKFVQIDRDNFDEVMASLEPSLNFVVPNKLDDASENLAVDLKFQGLSDFDPMSIIKQVDSMRDTYERRNALNALLAKLYVNDDLASSLNEVIASSATDEELKTKLQELMGKL
jgi:type VI secretion system protein ImpB